VTGVESCAATTITSATFELNAAIINKFNEAGLNVHYVSGLTGSSGRKQNGGVYDFSRWALEGSAGARDAAALGGVVNPRFPSEQLHDGGAGLRWVESMDAWDDALRSALPSYLGSLGDTVDFKDLPSAVQVESVAIAVGAEMSTSFSNVETCGSPGEVTNVPAFGNQYNFGKFIEKPGRKVGAFGGPMTMTYGPTDTDRVAPDTGTDRIHVWANVAFKAEDQLRQRTAWALSQVFSITVGGVVQCCTSEEFHGYMDIFARSAFGLYSQILKEVSYSPMMAKMLTYLNSVRQSKTGNFPDENYAREIMQLFSIGPYLLNEDGTRQTDADGNDKASYDIEDIENFARAWTGFKTQPMRGNSENSQLIDPMRIDSTERDHYPKTVPTGGYLGDNVALCVDLPSKAFLRKGAKYRFLGKNSIPERHTNGRNGAENIDGRFALGAASSGLFEALCHRSGPDGPCVFKSVLTLPDSLACDGKECDVDTVRVVEMIDAGTATDGTAYTVYYEYMREKCVDLAFFANPTLVAASTGLGSSLKPMCADPAAMMAESTCCARSDALPVEFMTLYPPRAGGKTMGRACNDGNLGNICRSGRATDSFLKMDLGSVQQFSGVRIYNRVDPGKDVIGHHVIETSNNDETWTQCFDGVLPTSLGPHEEACAATARYVRVKFAEGHASAYIELAEVQVVTDVFRVPSWALESSCEAEYSHETVTFATAQARCEAQGKMVCDFERVSTRESPACSTGGTYFWSTATRGCEMFVQVNTKGAIAVVDDVPELNAAGATPEVAGVAETSRTYSSVFAGQAPGKGHARSALNSAQAWSASHMTTGEWMQLDFGSVKSVVGIAVQGRAEYTQYVQTYTVDVRSDEGSAWVAVTAKDGGTIFTSSSTDHHVSSAMFVSAVQARFVRISPQTWTGFLSMRADAILEGYSVIEDLMRWTWSAHPADSKNFFRARWADGAFPQVDSPDGGPSCGGVCHVHGDTCMCPTTLVNEAHFVESHNLPARDMIVADLFVRHADPALFDGRYIKCTASVCNSRPGVVVWQLGGDGTGLALDDRTVFQVSDGSESGTKIFYRNMRSTIRLQASATDIKYSFRNPPSFHTRGEFTVRDAEHETDALLEYYGSHPNNAPFMASTMIQRFVTSNPSPRYVKAVATAFKEGAYRGFGTGKRGDMAATIAAVLLDDEARSPIMANDPSFGKVQEPIIKVMHLLRSLEFTAAPGADNLLLNYNWGQQPYGAEEGVFSFFQYDYQPSGAVQDFDLVAPEALALTTPNIINFVNGAHGLIKHGLGSDNWGQGRVRNWDAASVVGSCTYAPTNEATGAVEVIDELDDLLTGGRLNARSRMVIETAYNEVLLRCSLCGNVHSTGVPEGVNLASAEPAECQMKTGCSGTPETQDRLARWQIVVKPTDSVTGGITGRSTDGSNPDSLWVQGSNGKRFQIASVKHFAYNGKYTLIHPVADNAEYRPEMLTQFNTMFPTGTTFSFVRPGDPLPPPRTRCLLCAPEAIQLAKQLLVTTPEFHATAPGASTATPRSALPIPTPATKPFKAIVFMFLSGGVDSYNVLVPTGGCADGDMYQQYRTVRSGLALSKNVLLRLDAQVKSAGSEQVCTKWGLHPKLPTLQRMFNDGDALFIANAGNLVVPITIAEVRAKSKPRPVQQFNHRAAQKNLQNVDCTGLGRADGVLGRMMDSLDKQGYNTESYSANGRGATVLKAENLLRAADYKVLDRSGVPQADLEFSTLIPAIKNLTSLVTEAAMAETWASSLSASLDESKILGDVFDAVTLELPWLPSESTGLSDQMEKVAKLIKAQATGALTDDRQAFYVTGPNFDAHSGDKLDQMGGIDATMASFEAEMRAQGMWGSVTIVQASDFGRSLSSNGDGTDHGWGGNYWVAGGSVRGGQILGSYPNDISLNGDFDVGRGRMIPTTSWDMIWHGVAQWFGVDSKDMSTVLPNIGNFPTMLHGADMFEATNA
jgi:uncharacterized protein (DUF1501 family)/uncharacterized protein (DUF1800 family)